MVVPANRVMIELSRRASADSPSTANTIATNRIALSCETVSINTSKNAYPIDIPFSGVIAGESSSDKLKEILKQWVRKQIGAIVTPDFIHFASLN